MNFLTPTLIPSPPFLLRAAKNKAESLPSDPAKLIRLFSKVENKVFAPHRPCPPQQPPRPTTDAAEDASTYLQLQHLTLCESPRSSAEIGSPMMVDNNNNNNTTDNTIRPHPFPVPREQQHPPHHSPTPIPAAAPLCTQNAELMYRQRCSADSEALLASCPSHLCHLSQTYLKQADAFNLADQCNAGLTMLPQPEVVLSSVQEVPKRPSSASVVSKRPSSASPAQREPDSDGAAVPEAASAAPIVRFSFNLAHYNDGSAAETEKKKENHQNDDDDESGRKRARSEKENDDKEALKKMQAQYAAALSQFNTSTEPQQQEAQQTGALRPPTTTDSKNKNKTTEDEEDLQQQQTTTTTNVSTDGVVSVPARRQESIVVFCVEKPSDRAGLFYRNFTATSYAAVWRTYINAQRPGSNTLHWYEVVREGRPCHLYFDLEFGRSTAQKWNDDVDGDRMVDALLGHVAVLLARNWGLTLHPVKHVYELESSTDEKFSRHVLIRIPGYAFLNNLAVGHFVAQVVDASGTEFEVLKAPPPAEERVSFVDTAVYTKNRHFRMVYSCKGGKSAVLRPTHRFATSPAVPLRLSPAKVFCDTLICNVDGDAKLLAVLPPFDAANNSKSGGGGGGGVINNNDNSGIRSFQGDIVGRTVSWKRHESEGEATGVQEKIKCKYIQIFLVDFFFSRHQLIN